MTTTLHRIQDERLAGALAMLLPILALLPANFAGNGGNGGAAAYAVTAGACVLIAAALFWRILPSVADPGRAAWILAGLGVVSLAVFWSGLPFVLGIGAVSAGARSGRTAPAALGAVTVVLGLVACAIG